MKIMLKAFTRRVLCLLLAASICSTLALASVPLPPEAVEAIQAAEAAAVEPTGPEEATTEVWRHQSYTQAQLAAYDAAYRVTPASAVNNGGHYGGSTLDKAWDDDRASYWETSRANSGEFKNYIEFTFQQPEEIGKIVYGSRPKSSQKGFATRFEIWGAEAVGDELSLVATGGHAKTGDLIEIHFTPRTFQRLRFVWAEADSAGLGQNHQLASARVLYFYREDTLPDQILGLFTDSAATSLAAGVDAGLVAELRERLAAYPLPDSLTPYLDMADRLLSGTQGENVREPVTLSQRGARGSEAGRTAISYHLGNYDLTGYYARPGEKLGVYVDADPKGPMPHFVLATVAENPWSWAFTYDGIALSNGYNSIEVPADMKGCQAIYFYNPALPDQQAYPPTVRLVGGTKYPVFYYDAAEDVSVTREKERAFIEELTAYVAEVTDDTAKAQAGEGFYNMCEYYSDKIILSTSARGALKGLAQGNVWKEGDWRDHTGTTRFGQVQRDAAGEPVGILYQGPAATMESYEMLYDDLSLYSGFNLTDPTHEDYRNHNQFLFRAYSNGTGAGWAQSVYAGFNTGDQPAGSLWDSGFYATLASVGPVLSAGWTTFHEIGHVFDSSIIGTSESTNNLYALMAQDKYIRVNRLDEAGENRWYNHFTTYINTGLLPHNDMLFYPGAVTYQLDAVDFSGTKLYDDPGISNYGLACRYARLHREELNGLSKNDKLVLSMSMGCGVDLSRHFEYYGRPVSNEVKQLLSGLPKEERPTWYVNDRTFAGGAFTSEQAAKAPEFGEPSHSVDDKSGAVTLFMKQGLYGDDVNLQCFAVYRQELGENGEPVGEATLLGITGDNKASKNVNELYQFTDQDVTPGKRYRYEVGAYDCALIENAHRAVLDVEAVADGVTVPVQTLRLHNLTGEPIIGDGTTFNVGNTYAVEAKYSPSGATVNLNAIEWWAEGYARDGGHTGSGPDNILIVEDPNFPGDPTHRLLVGVSGGQTMLKARIGEKTAELRIVTNGAIKLNAEDYDLRFPSGQINLAQGDTYVLSLIRSGKRDELIDGQDVAVRRFPQGTEWVSSDPAVASVSVNDKHDTVLTAHKAGTVTLTFCTGGTDRATCTVTVSGASVALTGLSVTGEETVGVGARTALSCSPEPAEATVSTKPVWSSSDPSVARVDQNGAVTGVASGTAVITAAIGDIQGTKMITVPEYTQLMRIAVSPQKVTLTGEKLTEQLAVVREPENASPGRTAAWKSSDPAVVSVDENGLITARGAGSAVITASLDGRKDTCQVTVELITPLEGLKFKGQEVGEDITASLTVGGSKQLMVYPVPLLAGGLSNVVWTSSDPDVAMVKEGFVSAVGAGTAEITATVTQTDGGEERVCSVKCSVTVADSVRPLTGLAISRASQGLVEGDSFRLSLNNRPTNANRAADGHGPIGETQWRSSDERVAAVDADGLVRALTEGTALITGSRGGVEASCRVTVHGTSRPATGISLDRGALELRGLSSTDTLRATLTPQDATVSVYWVSSDSNVVKVDQAGNLTPVDEGVATVTASASGHQARCTVTVTAQKAAPVITGQPADRLEQAAGAQIPFSVEARKGEGMELPGALTYAWYWAADAASEGTLLTKGASDLYAIPAAGAGDAGYYYCVVSDHGMETLSDRARLTLRAEQPGEDGSDPGGTGGGDKPGGTGGSDKPGGTGGSDRPSGGRPDRDERPKDEETSPGPEAAIPEPPLPFVDVDKDAWYADAVAFVYRQGHFNGVAPDRFAPDLLLTRAMLTAVLNRLSGDGEGAPAGAVFLDVPPNAWYAGAVSWAVQHGIVNGMGDDRFAPDAPVTREQIVTMLWRYIGSPKSAGSLEAYPDVAAVSAFAWDAMRWAVENGLLQGKEGARLDPGGIATRAEMAAVLMRFLR